MVISYVKKIPVRGLFQVTRGYNLFIIFLTQYFIYIFFVGKGWTEFGGFPDIPFLILSCSTILIAAAGYIINDYHDVKIDMINKPSRVVIGNVVKRRIALVFYFMLSFAGVALGFFLSWKLGLINILSAGLLWLYSIKFKKVAFWGNLIIAFLTALSILIIYFWKPANADNPILAYAWFAFIITLIREIVKDMEDIKGDRFYGCRTLPIIWGIAATSKFLNFLSLLMLISLILAFFYADEWLLKGMAAIVIAQLVIFMYKLRTTDTTRGFNRLGKFCKIIMLTGIIAILLF